MATTYIQDGNVIQFTASSTIAADDVVVIGNKQLGIALVDIATSSTGSVATEGVFQLAKNTSDAVVIGQKLWWDATAEEVINAPALNAYFIGYAFAAAGASATTVLVDLEEFSEEGPRALTLAATGAIALNTGDFGGGDLILFAPNTAAQTVTLPAVAAIPPGSKLFVRKTSADVAAVTLDGNASETVGGGATFATIDAANDLAQFVSTGAAWALVQSVIA